MRRNVLVLLLCFLTLGGIVIHAQTTKNINVTATVPAQPGSLHTTLTKLTTGTTFTQGNTIQYELAYKTDLNTTGSFTIEASWSRGTPQGSGSPTVDILDYVQGSATAGYGGASPVVDLLNRKIVWTVSSLPQNVSQTITFSLKTTDSYTTALPVAFTVSAVMTGIGTQSATSSIDSTYLYSAPTPTPSPTLTPVPSLTPTRAPNPTATPGPAATPTIASPTLTPAPVASHLTFTTITLDEITSSSIAITAYLSTPASIEVAYGTSPNNLNKTFELLQEKNIQPIRIDNLAPNTTYFFLLYAKHASLQISSSVLVVQTTAVFTGPHLIADSMVVTSLKIPLRTPRSQADENSKIDTSPVVIPIHTDYEVSVNVENAQQVIRMVATIKRADVLGLNTFAQAIPANTNTNEMIPLGKNAYTARFLSPSTVGLYEVFVQIYDFKGGIHEEKMITLRVVPPLRILTENTGEPIENARVELYFFNRVNKTFELIAPQLLPIKNPTYTGINGELSLVLPQGTYRADVTSFREVPSHKIFTIGSELGQDFPTIYLEKTGFNPFTAVLYELQVFWDFIHTTRAFIQEIAYSNRFFELNAFFAVDILIALSFLSLSARSKVPMRNFFPYLIHRIKAGRVPVDDKTTVNGTLVDVTTNKPVPHATIYVLNAAREIIEQISTRTNGIFSLTPHARAKGAYIQVMHPGYMLTHIPLDGIDFTSLPFIMLVSRSSHENTAWFELQFLYRQILATIFEGALIFSIIFELALGYSLGWEKAAPFIAISVVNLAMWMLYLYHKSE